MSVWIMGEKKEWGGVASQSRINETIKQHMDWITNQKHVYPLKELVNGDCQHVAMETLTVELHHLIPYPIHSWLLVVVQRPWSLDGKPVVQLSREKWGNSVDRHCAKELRLQTKLFFIDCTWKYSYNASSVGWLANMLPLHIENKKTRHESLMNTQRPFARKKSNLSNRFLNTHLTMSSQFQKI